MVPLDKSRRLKKQLTLLNVYAIVVGATLGDGFFLLPGIAAEQAGPAVVLCYLIAVLPLIPAIFSVVELSTAMPRAGGVYYFIDRSTHPLLGTIGGLGTWCALTLKISFALIGMGVYINLFFPNVAIIPLASCLALLFGLINLFSAGKSGSLQVIMVFGLLTCIGWFIAAGSFHIEPNHFTGFFHKGTEAFLSTAGLVYISYIGITKIASVSEEIKDPERNLPLGIFLAMITVVIVYALGTLVLVGVVPPQKLFGSLTPVADAANILAGSWGVRITATAALLAFLSIANAGIMSASRYPLAMSRDHILPQYFTSVNKSGIPDRGIYITIAMVLLILFLFDPLKIAKLASAFQLLMFSLICLAVIVMRESRIESYDPGYRSPLYPWMQIFGMFAPFVLIFEIGMISLLFTFGLVLLSAVWYFWYARDKVERLGAMYHIFERIGQRRFGGLDRELRGILVEKGLRGSDPFDEVITQAQVIMLSKKTTFEQAVFRASDLLSQHLPYTAGQLTKRFLEDTKLGITPVTRGLALPHLRLPNIKRSEMVLLQCRPGIVIDKNMQIPDTGYTSGPIHAIFFLVSPQENPGQHLRILSNIAGHADDDRFIPDWLSASNENQLKKLFLKDKNFLSIRIKTDSQSAPFIGKAIGDLELPENCLIAFILRINKTIIPRGDTVLYEKDLITFIGEPHAIEQVYNQYGGRKQKKN
tara:strand:- start:30684 stop:32789 length:2106 start_codon:yes stop_codon:yes gene_type:complete